MKENQSVIGTTNQTAESQTRIRIFSNAQFGQIRTAGTSEQPLFCLADLCKAIGINNPRMVRNRIDKEDVSQIDTPTTSGIQSITYVTESGMYDVILRSDSPQAKPFRKWVTSEVLPSIRKSGGYMVAHVDETPEQIMARALIVAQDTINRQKSQVVASEKKALLLQCQNEVLAEMGEAKDRTIKFLQPGATFAKAVQTSECSVLVGDLARIIKQNGVEIGQNRLFDWLRKKGFLISRVGESYNLPTQKSLNMGLFEIKKTVITKPDGTSLVTTTPKVTGKGQVYFVNKFLYEIINEAELERRRTEQSEKGGKQ